MSDNLLLSRDGNIAIVSLNRPRVRNALDAATLDEIAGTFEQLGDDPSVRAILLKQTGDVFCAGADLNWLESYGTNTATESSRMQRALLSIDRCPKLVIAAVDGPAFAGGLGLAAASDAFIATRRSTFCLTEVRIGMAPALTTSILLRRIAAGQLRYLGTTAAIIDGERAFGIGLVDELATDETELTALVSKACDRAREADPEGVALFKSLLARLIDHPEDRDAIALESFIRGVSSPNAALGLKALRAREKAPWARRDR